MWRVAGVLAAMQSSLDSQLQQQWRRCLAQQSSLLMMPQTAHVGLRERATLSAVQHCQPPHQTQAVRVDEWMRCGVQGAETGKPWSREMLMRLQWMLAAVQHSAPG